jgi:hypothetical protein
LRHESNNIQQSTSPRKRNVQQFFFSCQTPMSRLVILDASHLIWRKKSYLALMKLIATMAQAMHTTGNEKNSFNFVQNIETSIVIIAREIFFATILVVELGSETCLIMMQQERSIKPSHEAISNIADFWLVMVAQITPMNKTKVKTETKGVKKKNTSVQFGGWSLKL